MSEIDDITFNLIDEHTVRRLQEDGDIELPYKRIDKIKDQRWNTKQMSSKLLQGILNGDSVPKIANSLLEVVGNNMDSAVRNARTMVTGAENRGRLDSYKELDDQGLVQEKVWIATPDSRTRASHLAVDGEHVDVKDTFSNGLEYPADPAGDPAEVYNCRCSMRSEIVGFRKKDGSISRVEVERGDTMHTSQMGEEKAKRFLQGKPITVPAAKAAKASVLKVSSQKIKAVMAADDYDKFMDLCSNAENGKLYDQYADEIARISNVRNGGVYRAGADALEFSYENHEGMSRYSTAAHELNHAFDHKIGRSDTLTFSQVDKINQNCPIGLLNITPVRDTPSNSDQFMNALRKDMEALKARGFDDLFRELHSTNVMRNATSGVQDALDGFYGTQKKYCGWGHGDRYYNKMYNDWIKGFGNEKGLKDALNELGLDASNQTKAKNIFRQYRAANEAWANVGSAVTCKGDELAAWEKYMPNTLAEYKKIVGGL